jgi:hypothetical protein
MQAARRSPPEAFRAADGMYYRRMMTVQSDASQSTLRRTPPPRQRLAVPAPDHQRPQPFIHNDRPDFGHQTDRPYEEDKFVIPSIEGQENHKTAPHNPFARTNPSHSHANPPARISRSQLIRRENLSGEFDIIDLTSPDDHHDTKRRRIENLYSDASMHRRYEQIEPLPANETRYVPMTSAHLDRPSGYRQYPLADPAERERIATTEQLGRGRELVHQTRTQPPVPLFRDVPATRPLEVLRHEDEIHHSPSDRTNSAITSRLRSLPSAESHSTVPPRRTSFLPSNQAERVPAHHDRTQLATPLEVIPLGREVRDYRTIYASEETTSSRRQPLIELEPVRSVGVSYGSSDSARSLNYVQTSRHRELEQLPHEILEYVQPDGTIREYVSAGRSVPTFRRVPVEVGEGDMYRRTQEYGLPAEGISGTTAPPTYRRYALIKNADDRDQNTP